MTFDAILPTTTIGLDSRDHVMAFTADHELLLDRIDEEMRLAAKPALHLFAKIIGSACRHIPILKRSKNAGRIGRLIEAEAWTDCALALVELELPGWHMRRLVYEGGEWLCSLSRQPDLPLELDDTVDASHEVPALAVLRAFVEVRRRVGAAIGAGVVNSSMATFQPAAGEMLSCDNFS
jgi:hypothetical protein